LKFATITETRELTYLDASAKWLLGTDKFYLVAGVTTLNANPGGRLELLDAHIVSSRYKLGLDFNMLRAIGMQRNVGTYIHRYFSSTELAGVKRLEDELTSMNVNFRQVMPDARNDTHFLSASVTVGLPLGDNKVIDTQSGAGIGDPEFSKINICYNESYQLKKRWDLVIFLDGQYAYDALPSSESYSIGGPQLGSAYDPSEIIGDHGLASRFEIKRRELLTIQTRIISSCAFYDIGTVWQYKQDPKDARDTAASAGLGLQTIASYMTVSIELAKPLTRSVASEGEDGKDVRIYGILSTRF